MAAKHMTPGLFSQSCSHVPQACKQRQCFTQQKYLSLSVGVALFHQCHLNRISGLHRVKPCRQQRRRIDNVQMDGLKQIFWNKKISWQGHQTNLVNKSKAELAWSKSILQLSTPSVITPVKWILDNGREVGCTVLKGNYNAGITRYHDV